MAQKVSSEVRFVRVGELGQVGTGSSDRNHEIVNGEYPFYVRSKEILRIDTFEFDEEAIIIPGEGGIGEIFHYVNGRYALHQRAYRIHFTSTVVDTKFAFYYFSAFFKDFISKKAVSATVTSIRKPMILDFEIPIPPMEVQLEIVRILDAMTSLQAELQAELEARRLQYEHYQHEVFDQLDGAGVQSVAVKDLGRWYGGGTPSKGRSDYWVDGTIPWISPKDMGGSVVTYTEDHITEAAVRNSATKLVPANAVALVARSSILDHTLPIAFVPSPSALNQDMKAVIAADGIEPRYVFHVLRANRARMLRTVRRSGGSVASLDSQKLWKFEVPVPGAEEQRRIIDFMDRFDLLTNDLSVGLPAELTARRKQYEYYRDKLLTFEELVA
jgi:type I restriction enzyme S subunit